MPGFFQPGRLYRHHSPRGSEGDFYVQAVGAAPTGFADPSEQGGVAFGWRRGPSPNGAVEGLGSYATPDYAGWTEVPRNQWPDGLLPADLADP